MAKEMLTKTFGIVGLVSQLKSGQINRDDEMQRSFVWGNKEQTDLLDSVFQSATTYIPPLIGAESEELIEIKGKMENRISLLDGKQRSTTLEKFLNDEIKLGYNIRPVVIEHEDGTEKTYIVAGKKWSELEEEVRLLFKACKIQMVYFKGMTQEERELQFIKLQGGKKLSNAEVNKVRIGCSAREFIYKQLATDLWTKFINVSANREVKFETMQQTLMVMSNSYDLSGKSLQAFSEDPAMISDDVMEKVESVTEYLNEVVKFIKKSSLPVELQGLEESEVTEKLEPKELKKYLKSIEYLKKVHVPVIYNTALKALLNDVSAKEFAKFVARFFFDVPARYKRFTESDTTSAPSVKIRIEEMDKALVNEFKIVAKIAEVEEVQPETQTENLDSSITAITQELGEENQEESNVDQEDVKTILNIIDNVA